ncbi:ArnT family glycosyltransferase [candidate division CSSED10-310 bacterium]|uniref:ArnT family glycosyltransferase n=1 Tax=candidate division CSSED10-310 bacterium TaxID=2855610 RepID=A0ABV6YTA7_UNCC1
MDKRPGHIYFLIILISIGGSLPFLTQPYAIDDPFTIRVGAAILSDPLRPYLQDSFWFDQPGILFDEFKNPPLVGYLGALVLYLFGDEELYFHLMFLPFFILSVLAFYELARKIIENALTATVIFLMTPAVLIQAHHVMPDIMCLSFYLVGLTLLQSGLERDKIYPFLLAGVAGGLSGLSKYSGCLWIVTAGLFIICGPRQPRSKKYLLSLMMVVLINSVWIIGSYIQYHRLHCLEVLLNFHYDWASFLEKILVILIHVGGNLLFLMVHQFVHKGLPRISTLFLVLFTTSIFLHQFWYLPLMSLFFGVIFLVAGLTFFLEYCFSAAVFLDIRHWEKGIHWHRITKDNIQVFLLLWLISGLSGTIFLTPFIASRYLILWIPALILLIIYQGEKKRGSRKKFNKRWLKISAAGMVILGLTTSLSDYYFSKAYKNLAQKINHDFHCTELYFVGHWGFQFYMEQHGFKALDPSKKLAAHAYLARPFQGAQQPLSESILANSRTTRWFRISPPCPLHLMDRYLGAGFYIHYDRPLPWVIGEGNPHDIEIRQFFGAP